MEMTQVKIDLSKLLKKTSASDFCWLPNICQRGYAMPPETKLSVKVSLSDRGSPYWSKDKRIVFTDTGLNITLNEVRLEVSDADTGELYEDFWLGGVSLNVTGKTEPATGQFIPEVIRFREFTFFDLVKKTPYMRSRAVIPQLPANIF